LIEGVRPVSRGHTFENAMRKKFKPCHNAIHLHLSFTLKRRSRSAPAAPSFPLRA
jgi:hypothetical protein